MTTIRRRARCLGLLSAVLLAPGAALAAAAATTAFTLLPAGSSLTYTFKQAGADDQGRFNSFAVSFDPGSGRLEVAIEMRSLDTGDAQRDGLLAGHDFFDVAQFPQARFDSTHIVKRDNGYVAFGSLTIRGVTRRIALPFTWRTREVGGRTIGRLAGSTALRRLDYGIGRGQWSSTEWVGNRVIVRFDLELTPTSP